MKKTFFVLTMLVAGTVHASYNSNVPGKSVRCTGPQVVVIINKARTEITVINANDPGHPEKYQVLADGKFTDGDTMVSYRGSDNSEDPSYVDLNFDDQGDSLVYREDAENPIKLKCP